MIRKFKKKVLSFFSLFFVPYLHKKINEKLSKITSETQIFLMTRMDFGTFIFLLHYAAYWEKLRGKTCVVILNSRFKEVEELSKYINPQTFLISPRNFFLQLAINIFGPNNVNEIILYRVYGLLFAENPQALRLFDYTVKSNYITFFDDRLKTKNVPNNFRTAYQDARRSLNYNEKAVVDYFHLHHKFGLSKTLKIENTVRKELGLKGEYVLLNVNCKKYKEKGIDRKRILYPERYNCIIDQLIEKGLTVVIQGRDEQPIFKKRKGLIDYSKSHFCSIKNDMALFSEAFFAILSKTGPESFCTVFQTPQLGLNYSELISLTPHMKLRFFPKFLRNKKSGQFLHWKDCLYSPSFFDIGKNNYDDELEYIELEQTEMIKAVEEFLPLINQNDDQWLKYSAEQEKFREHISPLHLDLYESKAVPCEAFLFSEKFR